MLERKITRLTVPLRLAETTRLVYWLLKAPIKQAVRVDDHCKSRSLFTVNSSILTISSFENSHTNSRFSIVINCHSPLTQTSFV